MFIDKQLLVPIRITSIIENNREVDSDTIIIEAQDLMRGVNSPRWCRD